MRSILIFIMMKKHRHAIRKDEILSAIVKSGRSYEEIMNFLNVEETERKTEE